MAEFVLTDHTVVRLCDVVQSEGRLYLVFEFVDKDLKKYFEACDGPLSASLIKVIQIAQGKSDFHMNRKYRYEANCSNLSSIISHSLFA